MNKKVLKYGGFGAIIVGTVAVFFGGGSVDEIVKVVGLVFSAIGIIVTAFATKA